MILCIKLFWVTKSLLAAFFSCLLSECVQKLFLLTLKLPNIFCFTFMPQLCNCEINILQAAKYELEYLDVENSNGSIT